MLRESGQFRASQLSTECILDSNDLERERGITILAKNIAIPYKDVKINIIDTPGHADFGGEVERVLQMADGCLVLVDAAEGPMPQTRFVLSKALELGLRPIVVINKIDRKDARPHAVVDEMFDLFIQLGADDSIADFPYIFASSKEGFATPDPDQPSNTICPLMDMILEKIPGPKAAIDEPLQMLVTTIDWSEYVGRIAIGHVRSGRVRQGDKVVLMQSDDQNIPGNITNVHTFNKLGRVEVKEAGAGDIVALVGLPDVEIGDTICAPEAPIAMPRIKIDQPTLRMTFSINSSPMAGVDGGKYLTNSHLRDRLMRELERNVALQVEPIEGTEKFAVSGRGILHLSVLIETMRRESYELSVGKPEVILRKRNGVVEEPFETLVVEVPDDQTGPVIELVGARRGQMIDMSSRNEQTVIRFSIPARGLIGLRTRLLSATQGTAIINHRFESYRPKEEEIAGRSRGVLVSIAGGKAVGFSLDGLQARSELHVSPGDPVYEGMIVGENARPSDMDVNPTKEKKLTNMRASGTDRNFMLRPARYMTLEESLEFIEEDELVEVTPKSVRLRKIHLREVDRKRVSRAKAKK